MGQPAIGACRTGRSTGGRSELGGACRFAPVVSQRVRARWSGSWSYVVRRVLWYACRGGRTFTAAASKWPTICNVTNGTAVGRRLLRWPLRAQLLCMSLAKNAVMMAPRAWRRSALSEDFEPFRGRRGPGASKIPVRGGTKGNPPRKIFPMRAPRSGSSTGPDSVPRLETTKQLRVGLGPGHKLNKLTVRRGSFQVKNGQLQPLVPRWPALELRLPHRERLLATRVQQVHGKLF